MGLDTHDCGDNPMFVVPWRKGMGRVERVGEQNVGLQGVGYYDCLHVDDEMSDTHPKADPILDPNPNPNPTTDHKHTTDPKTTLPKGTKANNPHPTTTNPGPLSKLHLIVTQMQVAARGRGHANTGEE